MSGKKRDILQLQTNKYACTYSLDNVITTIAIMENELSLPHHYLHHPQDLLHQDPGQSNIGQAIRDNKLTLVT